MRMVLLSTNELEKMKLKNTYLKDGLEEENFHKISCNDCYKQYTKVLIVWCATLNKASADCHGS